MFNNLQLSAARRIEAAAFVGLTQGFETALDPLYCLRFARRVWEVANDKPDRAFYSLVAGMSGNPSAQEMEDLLRAQRPAQLVAAAGPGDFVFWHDLPPKWGHVGIGMRLGTEIWIAQNTTLSRGFGFTRHLRLIKLAHMPKPTSIFRL